MKGLKEKITGLKKIDSTLYIMTEKTILFNEQSGKINVLEIPSGVFGKKPVWSTFFVTERYLLIGAKEGFWVLEREALTVVYHISGTAREVEYKKSMIVDKFLVAVFYSNDELMIEIHDLVSKQKVVDYLAGDYPAFMISNNNHIIKNSTSDYNDIESLALLTGEVKWKVDFSDLGAWDFNQFDKGKGMVESPPVFFGDYYLVVQVKMNYLVCIDTRDGKIIWKCEIKIRNSQCFNIILEEVIYVVSERTFYKIRKTNGDIIFSHDYDSKEAAEHDFNGPKSIGILVGGKILAACGSGIFQIDIETGQYLKVYQHDEGFHKDFDPILIDNKLFLVDVNDRLLVLNVD
jgi:outer membrane protein assembly factor BamB